MYTLNMYTLYGQIIKNDAGHVCSLVSDKFHIEFKTIGGFSITSYIPIPLSDITNFIMKLTTEIRDVFDNSSVSKTEVFYITVSKKKSRVFTVVDSEPRNSRPYIAEIVLILPISEWEILFKIQEEIKDFFQENLC